MFIGIFSIMRVYLCIVVIALSYYNAFALERKLKTYVNPGCSSCNTFKPLVHVVADSEVDSIHHIWDFSGKPTFLIAHTPLNTSLVINWPRFKEGKPSSIYFSSQPEFSFSTLLDKVIDFNDVNNTGIYHNVSKEAKLYSSENFTWNLTTTHNDSHASQVVVVGKVKESYKNGTVRIRLSAFGVKEHGRAEPHLLHTTNSSEVDFSIEHFTTGFAHSRFALQFIAVSSDRENASVSLQTHKTIDDEHTPGIFTVAEYLTEGSEEGRAGGGYLQWQTVAYTSVERGMSNKTLSHQSAVDTVRDHRAAINPSLLRPLLADSINNMSVHSFVVSFGSPDDSGYYTKTNYLYWSLLMGYGAPAGEAFSLLVVVLISVALNIVALLAVVLYVMIVTRRIRRNKNDLFFSH